MSDTPVPRVAIVTGASSGFGFATARQLAGLGYTVVAGARRVERAAEAVAGSPGVALELDVRDPDSIRRFVAEVGGRHGKVDVLVNNAGLALELTPIESTDDQDWIGMWETNVLGLLRMTRECLPWIRRAAHGHIVNVGSVAGFESYRGGAGYTATKHAVRTISRTLRLELNGEPIRVSEIAPGMAETEFSLVRFKGDAERARAVYQGVQPLTADDVAECIVFAITRPPHVDIDEMVIRPVAQAASFMVARQLST